MTQQLNGWVWEGWKPRFWAGKGWLQPSPLRRYQSAELGVYLVQGVSCRRTRGVNHRLGPVNRRYAACSAAFDAGRKKSDCHSPGRALASGRMAPDALP